MVEVNTPDTPAMETTAMETPVKPAKIKDRTLEELENVATKTMSPSEIKKYVDYLREECAVQKVQLKSLKEAFTGVQEQKERQTQLLQQYQLAAKTQIQFCKDTVAQAYKTLHYMQPIEDITGGIN